jgi:hypothetical protein
MLTASLQPEGDNNRLVSQRRSGVSSLKSLRSQNLITTLPEYASTDFKPHYRVVTVQDHLKSILTEKPLLDPYLTLTREMMTDPNSAEFLRFNDARDLVRDYDELFQRFMDEVHLENISKAAGLKIKKENTIVEKWPMRLKPNSSKKDFDILLASGHVGCERYVEWESLD